MAAETGAASAAEMTAATGSNGSSNEGSDSRKNSGSEGQQWRQRKVAMAVQRQQQWRQQRAAMGSISGSDARGSNGGSDRQRQRQHVEG